jgi:hypothetical protein
MDLINDLDTDIAFAILMDERYRRKIDREEALALIDRIVTLRQSAKLDIPAENEKSPRPQSDS